MNMNIRATMLLAVATACAPATDARCLLPAAVAALPADLREASGATITAQGVLWVLADSGEPLLYALGDDGRVVRHVRITNARVDDWESLAHGPCPDGECLFIGAIGDNLHRRRQRTILRIPVPQPGTSSAEAERIRFRYPDGPSDAEALLVAPDGAVYIITKGRNRAVGLYRYPTPLLPDSIVTLEHVQNLTPGIVQLPRQPTGAASLGSTLVVRSYSAIQAYVFDADTLRPIGVPIDLTPLGEPQGEGVAAAPGGVIVLVGESEPTGTVARLQCDLEEAGGTDDAP